MSKRSAEYEFVVWLATTARLVQVLEVTRLFMQAMPEVAHLWIEQADDDKSEWIRPQQFDRTPVDPVASYEQWLDRTLDRLPVPEAARRKAEIVERYRDGESQHKLAQEYGVPQSTISDWCLGQEFGEGGVEMNQEEARAMLRELRGSNELMHRIELNPGLSGTLHEIEAFAVDAEAETEKGIVLSAIDEANEGTLAQQILRELRIQRQLLARIHQGNQERLVQELLRVPEDVREAFLLRIPEEARQELLDAIAEHDAEQLVREVEQYLENE